MPAGTAGSRPEKRARSEAEAPAANKRAAYLPYARGGYNSEEWVFDDDDDEEEEGDHAEQLDELGADGDQAQDGADLDEANIRSLEVTHAVQEAQD